MNVRKFEWRSSSKFKLDLRLSAFMDINDAFSASADSHAGHLVDDLGDILVGLTAATSAVTYCCDGEYTWFFCDASECGRR